MRTHVQTTLVPLLLLAACAAEPAIDPAARAEAAARQLGSTLIGELTTAMQDGTPADAVHVCADVAQRVSSEIATSEGVVVRRTSLRVRNPVNAPDDHERRVLEEWGAVDPKTLVPHTEIIDTAQGRELRWMRPIVLVGLCVNCHGSDDDVSTETREAIAVHYPADQATGFSVGELRGAFSVTVPLD